MPDNNTQTTQNPIPTTNPAPVSDAPAPAIPAPVSDGVTTVPDGPLKDALKEAQGEEEQSDGIISEVANKIAESQNILIALSSDPSVDELAAAIGLSLYLDKLGKRATAIYSGSTPNALEFLKPEETFESTADALQDFVIALNKEKADHLRYKLDGDYVKIYITPYKERIAEEDLDYSYGDFNIDLVLALDVANGIDLDSALREHGRIMHDAVIVNITTGKPGKLGEIEWSDKNASSVSEMVAKLLYGIKSDISIEKDEATAFLTGIVAATNSFSNASTTSETMKISAQLMESGADQQLIAKNITSETENEILSYASVSKKKPSDADPTALDIKHEGEEPSEEPAEFETIVPEESEAEPAPAEAPVEAPTEAPAEAPEEPKADSMMDDLKAAEASLATAGDVATPVIAEEPIRIEGQPEDQLPPVEAPSPVISTPDASTMATSEPPENPEMGQSEMVIAPSDDFSTEVEEGDNKYGQMLEDALAESGVSAAPVAPIVTPPELVNTNPAASFAPPVPTAPEINGVPEINYMPMPDDGTLPPPPTPPIDFGAPAPAMEMPAAPAAPAAPIAPAPEVPSPVTMGGQPAMQDQVYNQQAANPGAFKIPGM